MLCLESLRKEGAAKKFNENIRLGGKAIVNANVMETFLN